jgi:hypothetical protein
MGDQSFTALAATAQPRHVGRNGGLVDEDQPGRIKQNLLASSAGAPAPRPPALALPRIRTFFNGDLVPFKEPPDRAAASAIPRWRISSKVKSGCLATNSSNQAVCASNGDVLAPIGFAAALPNRATRCTHRIAELTLTSKRSAASCRDAPASTGHHTFAQIQRIWLRHRSPHCKANQCESSAMSPWESRRFTPIEICFSHLMSPD